MKKQILIIALLALLVHSSSLSAQDDSGELTLNQACRMALANSPRVKEMAQRLTAAEQVLRQARSLYYPTVSAGGAYNQVSINLQPESNPLIRADDSYAEASGHIAFNWLIFDGFAREARNRAASAGTNASAMAIVEIQRLLLKGVTTAFHQAQLAIERKIIAQQDRDFNRNLEADARKRWQVGAAPEAEMMTFAVNALMAEAGFVSAQRDYDIACALLATLLALPDAQLPQGLQPGRETVVPEQTIPDWLTETAYALTHRPDLEAVRAQKTALEHAVSMEKGRLYPSLALVAGAEAVNRQKINPVDQNNRNQYAGIVASWDVFSGWRDIAAIREAQANLEAINEQLVQKELDIQSAIRQCITAAAAARDTWLLQKSAFDLSRKIRDHVEKAYKAGTTSLTRLNQVQTDLVRAEGAAASARIAFVMALAELDAESGRILNAYIAGAFASQDVNTSIR